MSLRSVKKKQEHGQYSALLCVWICEQVRWSRSCDLIGYLSAPSCPLGIFCVGPTRKKFSFWLYKKYFINQACLLKKAGYWPCSFLCFYWPQLFLCLKNGKREKKLMTLANIQPSWRCAYIQLNVSGENICHSQMAICGGSICCILSVTCFFFMLTGVLRCGTLFTHLWMTLRQCSWYEKLHKLRAFCFLLELTLLCYL